MKLEDRLEKIGRLALDPFKPELLHRELESLLEELPGMSKEELILLRDFLEELKPRLEENYRICFGWFEEVFKKGLSIKA